MNKINWKVRFKNPSFWVGLAGVIVSPVLAYFGAKPEDMTTWKGVGDMIVSTVQNPYLLFSVGFSVMGFLGVLTDPTTAGIGDSNNAMTYLKPFRDNKTE